MAVAFDKLRQRLMRQRNVLWRVKVSNPSDNTIGSGFDPSKQSVQHKYRVYCLNKTSAYTGGLEGEERQTER